MENETFDPTKQLLPLGYWVRFAIVSSLAIGGIVCMFYYNEWVGIAISFCAPIFARLSGLREMTKKYKTAIQEHKERSLP